MATTTTAEQQKASKLDRMHEKNRKFLLTPKDHKERVVEPLVKRVNHLLSLAAVLGNSSSGASDLAGSEKTDAAVVLIRKKFVDFKDDYVKTLRLLGTYYSTLYKVNGNRAKKAATGEAAKPRQAIMFRSVASFKTDLYNFIREASTTHEDLRPAGQCVTFDSSSPMFGYMSPTYAAQFVLAYVACHRRFNKTNGQYIQPDDLMKKHLGAGIAKVMSSIEKSVAAEQNQRKKDRLRSFPGQFSFCKLQELIGFYREKPEKGSPADVAVTALRKNESNWPQLRAEFDTMSQVRAQAYERLHADAPKTAKTATGGQKGPRGGPLSEEKKQARRIKREANALASTMGMELTLVKKAPKPLSAESAPAAAVASA